LVPDADRRVQRVMDEEVGCRCLPQNSEHNRRVTGARTALVTFSPSPGSADFLREELDTYRTFAYIESATSSSDFENGESLPALLIAGDLVFPRFDPEMHCLQIPCMLACLVALVQALRRFSNRYPWYRLKIPFTSCSE
jgi:hypothetical protein